LTPTAFPFFIMDLTGGLSSAELHDYGFYVIRPALARVPGVGRVEVLSSDTREIEVIADPGKLVAAGRFTEEGSQHLVLASGQWQSAADIANTPVLVKNGSTLRVGDLATVT